MTPVDETELEIVCNHKWELIHDWIGDQNVINGTQHFSYWLCKKCDAQSEEPPEGCDDRDGPEYERD
jgi:hypothetical protein